MENAKVDEKIEALESRCSKLYNLEDVHLYEEEITTAILKMKAEIQQMKYLMCYVALRILYKKNFKSLLAFQTIKKNS